MKALELGLPVYQPLTLKNDDARQLFETLAPDLLVVVAYGKLLPPWLLELPRYGAREPSWVPAAALSGRGSDPVGDG